MLSISPPPSYVVKLTSTADDDGIAGDEEEESDEDECNDDANNSEDDDEVGTGGGVRGSKKQKWTKFKNKRQQNAQKKKLQQLKQSQKQRSTTTIWSGVNADISRRAYSDFQNVTAGMIRDDDTLLLNGQWACEIVCLLDNNSDAGATITSTASSSSLGRRSSGLLNKGSTMMNKQQKSSFKGNSLVGEKNGSAGSSTKLAMPPPPRAPLSSMRANGIQPFRSKKTGLGTGSTLPSMRVTRLGGAPSHASATTSALPAAAAAAVAVAAAGIGGVNTMGAKRQQDTANEKYDQSDTSDGEDGDHDENETNANPSSYKIPPSLLRSASSTVAKRPRTVPPTTLGSTFSSSHFPTSTSISGNIRNDTSTGSNITDFPGAKGERINVPASLRNALRPHQREGIAFLWNCVTGVNEGLKNAFYRADVGSASGSVGGSFDENEDDDEDGDDGKRSSVAMPMSDVVPRGAVLADEMGLGKVSRSCQKWQGHSFFY